MNVNGSITDGFGVPVASTPDNNGWILPAGIGFPAAITTPTDIVLPGTASGANTTTTTFPNTAGLTLDFAIPLRTFSLNPNVVIPTAVTLSGPLNLPGGFVLKGDITRPDGTVLYVARDWFQIVARILCTLPAPVAAGLRPRVPLFTWRLRPGVGVAEEPNTGESFGMHRCRLVAEGIFDAWQLGHQSVAARLRAVAARFAMNGFEIDAPYLNPGSRNLFPMPVLEKESENESYFATLS